MLVIEKVVEQDVKDLIKIYAPYVLETVVTFDEIVPTEKEFFEKIKKITKKYPFLVAKENEKILGYAYANTFKDRVSYDWTVEISIYLDKNIRGKGVGRKLYNKLEEI